MTDDDGEWDSYPCRVDDQPASILVDFRYEGRKPPRGASTLYWVMFRMLDPAEHGMGSADEAAALNEVDDRLGVAVAARGLVLVGRLRSRGVWQLAFYGPPRRKATLAKLARGAEDRRMLQVGSKPDRSWGYYREFLLPDAERRQWILDRRVVEDLRRHGDVASVARPIDHRVYFASAAARRAFLADAAREGFARASVSKRGKDARPYAAHVRRVDTAELDQVHAAVTTLFTLAERHDGVYDGWETSVERKPAKKASKKKTS